MRTDRLEDLPVHEFIDMGVELMVSCDPTLVGTRGRIIDETMNTFRIERPDGGRITVQKSSNTFKFDLARDMKVIINGEDLAVRPQDRIKKLFQKRKQLVRKG
jgi:ribonuclease P protein subunit POP4